MTAKSKASQAQDEWRAMSAGAHFRRVAILGARPLGTQVAALCANADAEVVLYALAGGGEEPLARSRQALARLHHFEPNPLASPARLQAIQPATYQHHLDQLRYCDLVVEAGCDECDGREGLLARVAPYLHKQAVVVSTTANLSVRRLAQALPESLRARFCGLHFLTPLRCQRLVELIPGKDTDERVLERLESYLVTALGKDVVRVRDTPPFVVNRLAVVAFTSAVRHAERCGLGPDQVDALLAACFGMPASGLFGAVDQLGLTRLANLTLTMQRLVPDDPWLAAARLPPWLTQHQVCKSGGVYRRHNGKLEVLEPSSGHYRPVVDNLQNGMVDCEGDPAKWLATWRSADRPEAQFLLGFLADLFQYAACQLDSLVGNAREFDLVLRSGLGLQRGLLETWQAMGWRPVLTWLGEAIRAGQTLAAMPLPHWVDRIDGVYSSKGAYAPEKNCLQPRRPLAVYRRQLQRPVVIGESIAEFETWYADAAVKLWDSGDDVAVITLLDRSSSLSQTTLAGLRETLAIAIPRCRALIVEYRGRDISSHLAGLPKQYLEQAQTLSCALRYAPIPVVAAVKGQVSGVVTDWILNCDRRVADLETYLALGEPALKLPPGAGGCLALVRQTNQVCTPALTVPLIQHYASLIGDGRISSSADDARQLGMLAATDPVVFNSRELLFVAKVEALALAAVGYRAPPSIGLTLPGRKALTTLRRGLAETLMTDPCSKAAFELAIGVAEILCGVRHEAAMPASESEILSAERAFYLACVATAGQPGEAVSLTTIRKSRYA